MGQMLGRVRVARVIARMNVGGPARQVSTLLHSLDPDRYEQLLLIGSVSEGEADELEVRGADLPHRRVRFFGPEIKPANDLLALNAIARELREFRPHIVHTHTAKAGLIGRLASLRSNAALVHTFHGHVLRGYFSPPVTRAIRATERWLARRTNKLVAVGERVRDELLEAGIGRPEQYAVVPPGIGLGPIPNREIARKRLGIAADVPVVCFVARLTQVKRPDRFIETAGRIRAVLPDVQFIVAGGGELLELTRHQAIEGRLPIRFLGWRSDVETIYAASDLVLLTSDNEGMPVSLIEAAIAGRPAVTTDVGSAAEVVIDGSTGFVVGSNAGELADAVVRLLTKHAMRRSFGASAEVIAMQRFSSDRLVAATDELYATLINGNRESVLRKHSSLSTAD